MEPLLDLSPLEAWRSYHPSTAGYVEAPQEELRNADIMELFSSLEHLEGDRTLAGHFVIQNAPSPGIIIDGETLSLPVSAPAYARLAECGSKVGETPIHQIGKAKVQSSNPAWAKCLKKGVKRAIAGMTANGERFVYKQSGMVVITNDCTDSMRLHQASRNHFATALVIMPSDQTSAVITFEAHHGHLAYRKEVRADQFATQFVAMYTGLDSVVTKVSGGPICFLTYHISSRNDAGRRPTLRNLAGPRDEIATAFAAWQLATKEGADGSRVVLPRHILYQLDGEYPEKNLSVEHLNHPKDKLVLGHLAPPAKQYGFRILLARISIVQTASCTVANGSDDEDDDDYSPDDFNLRDDYDWDPEYEWEFTSLIGEPIEATLDLEKDLFGEIEQKESIYNRRIDLEDETGKESEVDRDGDRDESCFFIRYNKHASFLFIVPEGKEYAGLRDLSPPRAQTAPETSAQALGLRPYEAIETTEDEGRGQKRQRMC